MNLFTRYVALPALLASSTVARAEPPGQGPDEPTRYSFEDTQIMADTTGPMGEVMTVRRGTASESLVRARESFVAELLRSVEQL